MLNNWRMAQLHAQEAPDRVKELEAWGALFDRTADGRILQRNFGGHRYAAPRPRRRPHGARDDPHAAAARRPLRRSTSYMECTVAAAARPTRDGAIARRVRLLARERAVRDVPRQGGRAGDRRHRASLGITSNSWECTGDGHALALLGGRRAHGHGVHPVPPDRDGLAAQRARDPHHRGRARRRRHAAQQGRQALHVRLHPRHVPRRDGGHRGGGRPAGTTTHAAHGRPPTRSSCPATRSPARSTPR